MTQDELRIKVINAENAVKKRENILDKNRKKLQKLIDKGADSYDIEYCKRDIKDCESKLKDTEQILSNWQEKYNKRISEDEYLEANCPDVIKNFLEKWKVRVIAYYQERYPKFIAFKKDLREQEYNARRECINATSEYERYRQFLTGDNDHDCSTLINVYPRKQMEDYLHERGLDYKQVQTKIKDFGDMIIFKMYEYRNEEERNAWLEKTIEAEKRAKLLDLMSRICEYVGTITDAAGLTIGPNGNINGLICGIEGKATIETIGAGGYNIQIFHFRTLIHPLKEKTKTE